MVRIVKLNSGYSDRPNDPRLEIWTPRDTGFYSMMRSVYNRRGTNKWHISATARLPEMIDQTLSDQYTHA